MTSKNLTVKKMKISAVEKEAQKTADAIIGTLKWIDEKHLDPYITDKIEALMRQSYRLGMLKETYDQIVLKRLFEDEEEN